MQTMEELIPITAVIGDRSYRIKIQPEDEEVVRKTLKTINDKIVEFKTMFAGKDMQDYIAMVLVWYATEQNNTLSNELKEDTISAKLDFLEKMLDGKSSFK
jgi:Cell division protein ZapA